MPEPDLISQPDNGDPGDHPPDSFWSLVVDPGDDSGRVDDLAVISERIAPGDRIPLHFHHVSEVILVDGPGRFRLGDDERAVDTGAVAFIPAGVPHGFDNPGIDPLSLHAVFPTQRIWLRSIERNPAPGTAADAPARAATYDVRTGAVESDPE